nr:MAG TPA: SOS-response transcriptional repressor [Caudoviricetes sp.]
MAYSNLKAEMGRKNVTIEAVAKILEIHRNSVANKLNGTSSFTIEEAMKIKNTFFPNLEYRYLFATEK